MDIADVRILGNINAKIWTRIYETTITTATTSVTISGLDGDTDEEYRLIVKIINGAVSENTVRIRPNNDSGNNYYCQQLYAINTTISASRYADTGIGIGYNNSNGQCTLFESLISSKSGNVRVFLNEVITQVSETTVNTLQLKGEVWNNTVDNITSLVITSNTTEGIGVGTIIELYKRRDGQ